MGKYIEREKRTVYKILLRTIIILIIVVAKKNDDSQTVKDLEWVLCKIGG